MKTMQFTNNEIALLFDAVDMMCDGNDDMMYDDISMTITNVVENNMSPDEAVKRLAHVCREHARIASLRERLVAMLPQNS